MPEGNENRVKTMHFQQALEQNLYKIMLFLQKLLKIRKSNEFKKCVEICENK